jgi:hypothetical protein
MNPNFADGLLVLCLITSYADAKSKQIMGKKVLLPSHRVGLIVGRSEGGYIILTEPRLKGRVGRGSSY